MPRYQFFTLDVFTDCVFAGNPLAVFPDAHGLTAEQMQAIAAEFNLSETTFVLPPEDPSCTARVRIFTPRAEMPFAGHPTIGTAMCLAFIDRVATHGPVTTIVFEEGVGPVPVEIGVENGRASFATLTVAIPPRLVEGELSVEQAAELLSLSPDDLGDVDWRPAGATAGVPFLYVPVRSLDALARARVDSAALHRMRDKLPSPHIYVFTTATVDSDVDIRSRMFAPTMGIEEDPATGAAAAALPAYLVPREPASDGMKTWRVRQGVEMGRPSDLTVDAEWTAGAITRVRVGGSAVTVSEGWITVP
ncbi:MAG: PhzF family phenazine biosynthesis protein [Deltaproteobacteria bacterium]|nr:PhzF family phenazine biosynthesis protein [Deltaproteobacteria bacterium]MCB9487669.1 PhzF family phenazine biosynthesis protein [Deltaproteobacteria bacterium]